MAAQGTFADYNCLIHKFAYETVRRRPWLEREDLVNQAWVILLRAKRQWKKGTRMKFTSFFYQKLLWYRRDLLRNRIREERATARFVQKRVGVPGDGIEVEGAARRLRSLVGVQLSRDEQRVLNLMLFPSVSFLRFLSRGEDRVCQPRSLATQAHYAKFLGIHARKASRVCAKISTLMKELVHDQEAE